MANGTLILQVASTLAMVGLIWFVQVVHYPLFSRVGSSEFPQYETDHQRLTSWVVIPLMLTELATATLLLWFRPMGVGPTAIWIGILLIAAIWLVTFIVQVPLHGMLTTNFDTDAHRKLVAGNWWRTVLWSLRGVLVLWMIYPST